MMTVSKTTLIIVQRLQTRTRLTWMATWSAMPVTTAPTRTNPDQLDTNNNGVGDACEWAQLCSYLGNGPMRKPLEKRDTDIFRFTGEAGEEITLKLEAQGSGTGKASGSCVSRIISKSESYHRGSDD